MSDYYIYSIKPSDIEKNNILYNKGYITWDIPFAKSKGQVGDIIYIYVTDKSDQYQSFLNYYKQIVYIAEILKINNTTNSKNAKSMELNIKELNYDQSSKLNLDNLRKVHKGFQPPQSYPIDLQENNYSDLLSYIKETINSNKYNTIENSIINEFRKCAYMYIDKYNNGSSRGWTKLQGDTTTRIVKEYIAEYIKSNNLKYEVSDINSYIIGFPTEFDLLIVNKGSTKLPYSNIYDVSDIKTIIEIKTAGVIGSQVNIKSYLTKIKSSIEKINKGNHINFVYLTLVEKASNNKNNNSINYFKITEDSLKPYKAFCLFDSFVGKTRDNEWNNFMDAIFK